MKSRRVPTQLANRSTIISVAIATSSRSWNNLELDECCKAMRVSTTDAYQSWYRKSLPPSATSEVGIWKQLALIQYRRWHCGDFVDMPVQTLHLAWARRERFYRHSVAVPALAARIWTYLRDNKRPKVSCCRTGSLTWDKRHLTRTEALATASAALGCQEQSLRLFQELLLQQASVSEHVWELSQETSDVPRKRTQLPDRTWFTVIQCPSLGAELIQYLRPLRDLPLDLPYDLMEAAIFSGDTETMEQLRLTGIELDPAHATRAIYFSQIKALEYLHAHNMNLSTCLSVHDGLTSTYGLIRDAIDVSDASIAAYLYSVGLKAEQWHLELAKRKGRLDLVEFVAKALVSQAESSI